MRVIEIAPLPNGGRNNSMGFESTVPEGWAIIPENMPIPDTFPFVNITVADIDGVATVTGMTAGTVPEPVTPTAADTKLAELNAACDAAIASGCDVTLSDGTAGHISLTIADQINLSTAQGAVASGAAGYAYHLDGALCEIYPAADIAIMASAATAHVLYHQTYCNHARQWAKRCTTEAELEAVTYGAALPDDLAEHMAAVLAAAKEGADA